MGVGADRTVAVELLAKVSGYTLGMTDAASATNAAADSMTRAAAAQAKLEASQRKATDATTKVSAAQAAQAAQSRKQLQALTSVGKGFLVLGGAAGIGLGLAVKAALDFNAKMALVGTLAHASGLELSELSSAALNVGQRFGYTATQVADAEAELVKAGVSVKDILGGALTGTLTLAAAGQINVADATEIAASAMTQFALKGKDVPHIADLLAAGADKALGSVADLGLGLSQVGTTAHQFGFSLDDTVAVLAEFAQQGQIGQKAGTELNQALLQLAAPTTQATDLMQKYGFSLYDAQGHVKTFAAIADNLQTSFQGATDAQRNQALAVIFGSRAIRAANILYQDGAATVLDWERKVNDAGFATQQATGKLDSLQGDLTKLKAAFQTGLIDTGDNSTTALRGLVQAITAVITGFDHLGPVAGTVVFDIAAVTTAVGLGTGIVLVAIPKYVAFTTALATLREQAAATAVELDALAVSEVAAGEAAAAAGVGAAGGGIAGKILGAGKAASLIAGPIGVTALTAGTIISASDAQGKRDINSLADTITNNPAGKAAGIATAKKQLADYQTQLKQLGQEESAAAKAGGIQQSQAGSLARQYQDLQTKIYLYSSALKVAGKATDDLVTKQVQSDQVAAQQSIAMVLGGQNADAMASAVVTLGQVTTQTDDQVKALAKTIQTDMTDAAKAFENDLSPIAHFTGGNLTKQFATSITQAKTFVADLNTVTARGLNPATVAQLISEGPKQAGPILQKLVGANGKALIKMTNQSQAALSRLEGQVVEDARLTAIAVNAQNDKIPQDLGVAMKIAAAKAKAGGTATAQGIATALHIGLAKVYAIASEYGIGLEAGIGGGTRSSETDVKSLKDKLAALNKIKASPSISLLGKQQVQTDIDAIKAQLTRLANTRFVVHEQMIFSPGSLPKGALANPNSAGFNGGSFFGGQFYSGGGSVWGGPPGRDTVNARLNNGEEVVRTERANLWRPLIKAINSAPAFASGGTAGRNSTMYGASAAALAGGAGHQTVYQVTVPKAQRNPYSYGEKVAIGAQRVLAVSSGSNTLPRW